MLLDAFIHDHGEMEWGHFHGEIVYERVFQRGQRSLSWTENERKLTSLNDDQMLFLPFLSVE